MGAFNKRFGAVRPEKGKVIGCSNTVVSVFDPSWRRQPLLLSLDMITTITQDINVKVPIKRKREVKTRFGLTISTSPGYSEREVGRSGEEMKLIRQ